MVFDLNGMEKKRSCVAGDFAFDGNRMVTRNVLMVLPLVEQKNH